MNDDNKLIIYRPLQHVHVTQPKLVWNPNVFHYLIRKVSITYDGYEKVLYEQHINKQ